MTRSKAGAGDRWWQENWESVWAALKGPKYLPKRRVLGLRPGQLVSQGKVVSMEVGFPADWCQQGSPAKGVSVDQQQGC